jgi:hypothetical protein
MHFHAFLAQLKIKQEFIVENEEIILASNTKQRAIKVRRRKRIKK